MNNSKNMLSPLLCLAMTGLYSLIMTIIMLSNYIQILPKGGLAIAGLWIINLCAPLIALALNLDGNSKGFFGAIIGAWVVAIIGTIMLFIALNLNISNYLAKHVTEEGLGTQAFWYICFFGAALGGNLFMMFPLITEQKPGKKERPIALRFVRYCLFFFLGLIPSAIFNTIFVSAGGTIAVIMGIVYPILCYFAMGFISTKAMKSADLSR